MKAIDVKEVDEPLASSINQGWMWLPPHDEWWRSKSPDSTMLVVLLSSSVVIRIVSRMADNTGPTDASSGVCIGTGWM